MMKQLFDDSLNQQRKTHESTVDPETSAGAQIFRMTMIVISPLFIQPLHLFAFAVLASIHHGLRVYRSTTLSALAPGPSTSVAWGLPPATTGVSV